MKANVEQTYALDTVRGHLWAFTAKEIMKQQFVVFLNVINKYITNITNITYTEKNQSIYKYW